VLLNPFKLHDLLGAVSSSLVTDPGLDLVSLASQFENLSSGKINFATLPNGGSQLVYPDGVATSIVQVDTAAIPDFVRRLMGQSADPGLAGVSPAPPASVTLDVLNGTPVPGVAGRNADALRRAGFIVAAVDSTEAAAATSVEYPPGQQSAAKAVAAAVPGATLVQTGSVQRVTLVLGTDGHEARGVAASAAPTPPASGPRSAAAPTSPASSAARPSPAQPAGGCIN
jgi:hypothetical protein